LHPGRSPRARTPRPRARIAVSSHAVVTRGAAAHRSQLDLFRSATERPPRAPLFNGATNMTPYPAAIHVTRPAQYDRVQVVIRVLIVIALGAVRTSVGALFGLIYLLLPIVSAVLVSQHGPEEYARRSAPGITRALRWVLAVHAYLALITDRFPTSEQ